MKQSTLLALVFVAALGINSASADMVDIGTGRMERSEFSALKAMVAGEPLTTGATVTTPLARTERYGMIDLTPADFQALRDAVAGGNSIRQKAPEPMRIAKMVNIGTGEMPEDEFLELKRMVQGKEGFLFQRLAATWP